MSGKIAVPLIIVCSVLLLCLTVLGYSYRRDHISTAPDISTWEAFNRVDDVDRSLQGGLLSVLDLFARDTLFTSLASSMRGVLSTVEEFRSQLANSGLLGQPLALAEFALGLPLRLLWYVLIGIMYILDFCARLVVFVTSFFYPIV